MMLSASAGGILPLCRKAAGRMPLALLCCALLCMAAGNLCAGEERLQLFDPLIVKAADRHHVSPSLIRAMIWRESLFLPRRTGSCGEIGLMQIRMSVVEDWARINGKAIPSQEELFDPSFNIEIGVWYISEALKRWENHPDQVLMALGEYNAGPTGFRRILTQYGSLQQAMEKSMAGKYASAVHEKYVEYCCREVDFTAASVPVALLQKPVRTE